MDLDAECVQAIHVLQLFLTSPRAVTKFAAIRILHDFASFKPDAVRTCNPDIESLISNSNRSIATFAITTLLKTGNESSVDRLLKQISSFMGEISDEFKVTVVEAIRTLCVSFPFDSLCSILIVEANQHQSSNSRLNKPACWHSCPEFCVMKADMNSRELL